MSFSAPQIRKLRTNVRREHIKERQVDGKVLPYVEAWHIIAEANRIFGHDGWDRETLSTQCVWQKQVGGEFAAAYVTRVRITTRADGTAVVREGFGAGEAFAATPGQAHERAVKTAETDATKRALTTFGSCFGLALYRSKPTPAPLRLDEMDDALPTESPVTRSAVNPVPEALLEVIALETETEVAAEEHVAQSPQRIETGANEVKHTLSDREVSYVSAPGLAKSSVLTRQFPLASTARQIVTSQLSATPRGVPAPVDKSELLIGEPKRIRNTEHLRFVAKQPCLICGRQPSDAHHLRFTQPRALGKKVSDEFTVPLCRFHHDEVHRAGAEIKWWQARRIEPLAIANELWERSCGVEATAP